MKKIACSMLLASAVLASSVYAGGPDVMAAPVNQNHGLFATAEGGYSWNSFGDTTVTTNSISTTASQTNNGGTARLAAGAIHYSSNPDISYTAEAGWGYYGKTSYTSALKGVDAQNYIYGLDLLAGVDYKFSDMFDGFFKLGGMLENIRMNRNTDLSKFIGGATVTGTDQETTTSSSIVPEIKIGGIYNITNAWGLSAAYMHVFGNGNVTMNVQKTADPDTSTTTATGGPSSLNTILFGVQYKFA